MHGTRLIDVPPADWAFVMGVNVWGIIHGIRHFVPAILKHGEEGHVVNTASVAGFQNRRGTNQGPYSMSKYAAAPMRKGQLGHLTAVHLRTSSLEPPQQSRQTSGFSRAFSDIALIEAKIVEEKAKNTKQFQRFSD
jgi:NAD(P)-dependent dehydrogenase (short-subunit alcohol dehydrogenase family)